MQTITWHATKSIILSAVNQPAIRLLRLTIKHFEANQSRQSARALTYTTLFAIVPLLTVLLVLLASITALEPTRVKILQFIYYNLLPSSGDVIEQYLTSFATASSNLTTLGGVFLFVTSILMLSSIERSFNQAWGVTEARKGLHGLRHYWMMITLGPIFVGFIVVILSAISSYKLIYLASIKGFLNNTFTGYAFINITFWLNILSFIILWIGYSLLFITMPNHPVGTKAAFISGFICAALLGLLQHFFGIFITSFSSFTLVYGAFAVVPVLLLWIHLTWVITLFGNELCYSITMKKYLLLSANTANRVLDPILELLGLLHLFEQKQTLGFSLNEREILDHLGLNAPQKWQTYQQILFSNYIIQLTKDNHYVLCRNLYHVDFLSFCYTTPYPMPRVSEVDDYAILHPEHHTRLQPLKMLLQQYEAQAQAVLTLPLSSVLNTLYPSIKSSCEH